jgi:hypothetical protein
MIVIGGVLVLAVAGVAIFISWRGRGKDGASPDAVDAAHSDENGAADEYDEVGSN